MADAQIGRPDFPIRPTGVVERAGSATDRQQRRQPQQQQHRDPERRDPHPPNPRRRRIYDMLFEEIDQIDALDERQRSRIKENIRTHLTGPPHHEAPHGRRAYATGYAQPPPPEPPPGPPAEPILANPDTVEPIDHDQIVQVAAPVHPHLPPDEVQENARLARQLRDCLALHTERARKVAVYLHLLLRLDRSLRPHLVVDI